MRARKNGGAYGIAVSALLAALSVVFLYLSNILPMGWIGFIAIAGLMPAAAIISGGMSAGLFCYAGTAILSMLLLPGKESAILYVLLFGHYPILKYYIERMRKLPLEWVLKLLLFNALFTILWLGFQAAFLPLLPDYLQLPLPLYLAGNAAFVVYDIGFTKLIAFYMSRIERFRRK
jgi:hypothetical protein